MDTLKTKLKILVLQHPKEGREPLGTVGLLAENLENVSVRAGLSWPNLSKATLEKAMEGHILSKTELMGTYQKIEN